MRVVRRFGVSLLMIWMVMTITFFMIRLMPGNPIMDAYLSLLQQGVPSQEAMAQIHVLYDVYPNQSVLTQYVLYVWHLLHGNFGTSIVYAGRPVLPLILASAPWTLMLVSIGITISFFIGLFLGVLIALNRNTWFDNVMSQIASIFHGIPNYVTGFIFLYFFTVMLPWFPFGNIYGNTVTPGLNFPFIASVAYHSVLPIAAYVFGAFGTWTLSTKSAAVAVLGDDFIQADKIRGLTPGQQLDHLIHNSVLPLFTGFVLSLGMMFGGAVFIEETFTIPGLGYLIAQSTSQRDYPVMQGCFLLLSSAVILANFLADMLYSRIDPRIRV
ncbi:MAG: ABC transporter permease [Firmicutes bacterium]|nr:ABC transporter permease [Bacillota bacterium]